MASPPWCWAGFPTGLFGDQVLERPDWATQVLSQAHTGLPGLPGGSWDARTPLHSFGHSPLKKPLDILQLLT